MPAIDFFPVSEKFPKPYPSQVQGIESLEKNLEKHKFVIFESPVGSGKSAMAITLARFYGSVHILIPRKILQDQYYQDFSDYLRVMKGKSAYPCADSSVKFDTDPADILANNQEFPSFPWHCSCSVGASVEVSADVYQAEGDREDDDFGSSRCGLAKRSLDQPGPHCTYKLALRHAQSHPIVAHNFWSFIFQSTFGGWHAPRPLLIIDEAHMMEDIIRGFATKTVALPEIIDEKYLPEGDDRDEWADFLLNPSFLPKGKDSKEAYVNSIESWREKGPSTFVVDTEHREDIRSTKISLIPENIAGFAHRLIFDYGAKVLLMSGTIFDKSRFCKYLGIPTDEACFIKAPSTFPLARRPVYVKDKYMVDTSHKQWRENLEEVTDVINTVAETFDDTKGLIHVPSYKAMREVIDACGNDRLVGHTPESFVKDLEEFYERSDNSIFVSPTCQQGVDFKQDRARFQILTRVPYLNAGDPFIGYKIGSDFPWYNYQALLMFGQMLGRINRGPDDFGATILLDERFKKFIRKNQRLIPKWQRDAFIFD